MSRTFIIHGEVLVRVKFGQHVQAAINGGTLQGVPISGGTTNQVFELGLATDSVVITLNSNYEDIKVTDYGPNVPADVMWNLATATIRMNLIHYDQFILDACLSESMAGSLDPAGNHIAGFLSPAGALMGNALPLGVSGCYYMGLNMLSNVSNWRFRAAYLAENPLTYPMGTKTTIPELTWRAIPYPVSGFNIKTTQISGKLFTIAVPGEIRSSGVVLFDHSLDF